MSRRRAARGGVPALKPYGFCCGQPHDEPLGLGGVPRTPRRSSFASLHSLHESPTLRIREEIITRRPEHLFDQSSARRSSSALRLGSGGGLGQLSLPKGRHATESALELIAQAARRQRQIEYERRMDRLAEIGRAKFSAREKRQHSNVVKGCEAPCWYTDLSLTQLQCLKSLEDAMFKDKEGKTISRTFDSLAKIGMVTDTVELDPKVLFKLINKYSDKPIEFLREIYKNIAGNYFEDEEKRLSYFSHERIIISAIVFLELPEIIIELHKRMPPIIQFEVPPKPDPPETNFKVKKMISPLLEKLNLPFNWKRYDADLFKWHKKLRAMIKPFVVLPKKAVVKKSGKIETPDADIENRDLNEFQNEISQEEKETDENHENHDDAQSVAKQQSQGKNKDDTRGNQSISKQQEGSNSSAKKKSDEGKIKKGKQEVTDLTTNLQDKIISYEPRMDWTEPPTPCPHKYRKLLDEKGPLKSDTDFFAELGRASPVNTGDSPCKRKYPPGRGGLSLKLQHYLLDVEADFFHLSQEANRITGAVGQIAQQILDDSAHPTCDACCACRQATLSRERDRRGQVQQPQTQVEGVATDETACRVSDNTRVLGATAMLSPAVSVSTASEPVCVPSTDEFFKSRVIGGTCIEPDQDEAVQQVVGMVKALEHIGRRQLLPERDPDEIKNVPACGCRDDDVGEKRERAEGEAATGCCAKRLRPNETRAYDCADFAGARPKGQTGPDEDEDEDGCGCAGDEYNYDCGEGFALDDLGSGDADNDDEDGHDCGVTRVVSREARKCNICKECGREIPAKCGTSQRGRKKNAKKKSQKKPAYECSCDSLSEFLQLDITVTRCVKVDKSSCLEQKPINRRPSTPRQDSRSLTVKSAGNVAQPSCDQKSIKTLKSEKSRACSLSKSPSDETRKSAKSKMSAKTEDCKSKGALTLDATPEEEGPKDPDDTGGPYGYRTASEAALPVVKTIAYLVDNHPPATPAETIPVREGGRPCRCRENRNSRRYMVYGLGGLAAVDGEGADGASEAERQQEQNEEQLRLIEGVKWVTPEPSIRGSDEYVPEYELYDSPYENLCNPEARNKDAFKETKRDGENLTDIRRWERAINDPYLNEFFTNKSTGGGCCSGTKCGATENVTKKLRVMKPVCECKNERRIVKRNEDRQKWQERQDHLKSFKKECFLHVNEVSDRAEIDAETDSLPESDIVYCGPKDHMTVISEVTMQTPLATPVESGTCRNLPYCPSLAEEFKSTLATIDEKEPLSTSLKENSKVEKNKSTDCKASEKPPVSKQLPSEKNKPKEPKREAEKKGIEKSQNVREINEEDQRQVVEVARMTIKGPRGGRFFEQMEEELKDLLEQEVQNMSDFYSLKLPDFHKMPQFKYWISYRVRGLKLRQKYKVDLKNDAMKVWDSFDSNYKQTTLAEPFILPKGLRRRKLDFNRALYAKRKIARLQMNYYTNLRNEMVDIGRVMWRTMEYGNFPDLSFKQAYFTYMPSRDKDAYVVNSFHS